MTDIKYAVVITTYNREELLRECVDHVQHQTIPPDSIIIVNNASTDGTELYLKTLSEQDKTVNIINLLENTGGAGGFAVGIERAAKTATTWMLAIDDDAVIAIDYMEKIFAVAQQNPTYRAFAGAVTVNGKIDTCHRRKLTGIGLMSKNCKEQAYTQPCFTCDIASFCGMVVDLSLVRQIGLPHAEYFIWYDDTEYSLRIHRHSCFLVVPQAVLLHKIAQIRKALQYIEDKIIWEQKNMDSSCKLEAMSLKKQQRDLGVRVFYEFVEIMPRQILIEGCIKGDLQQFSDINLILKVRNIDICLEALRATSLEREQFRFRFCIKRDLLPEKADLQVCCRLQNTDITLQQIWFGKFFPLTNQFKSSYLYEAGILLTYRDNMLCLLKSVRKGTLMAYEKNFQREMLLKRDKKVFRGWIARTIYQILSPLKRKELWLISDRLMKADDNGEAFFTYMNTEGKNVDIRTYFVLEKASTDYKRLKKIGRVVPYHSTRHKILSLLCDKKISSQADEYVYNRFFDLSYLYGDIQHKQKFVFLQHGVTKDDSSTWLKKTDTNISLFVTATNREYESILEYAYGYDKRQVICTGFPRYDYLYNDSRKKNKITFMPTWRLYLTSGFDDRTDMRGLTKGFADSAYCRMYHQVFSSSKLFEAADRYHYQIRLMLHPAMPRECISYFHCAGQMEILDRNTRYRTLYADSSLIVTDYSSAVFDFAYLRKPILYYQQDAEEFFSGRHVCRKGYFDYEKDGFGEVEYTADALIDRMIEYMKNRCQLKECYRERIERVFRYSDQKNCQRVYDEIKKL